MSSLIARRALAALAVAACIAGTAVRGADNDPSILQQRIDRLEALTARVEAFSAIKRLQHAYGHYSELGLWHDFADLFADTGIGYYTQGALDREGIRALFLKEVGGGRLGLADGRIYPHISMQPVITLAPDGQSARGRWHIMAMLGGYNASASWAGGVYENQYVRENGVWKMKEVRYHAQYSGRYEAPAWTSTREPAPLHYNATDVGRSIVDVPMPASAKPATLVALGKRMADLADRAQRLADEIEVANLQHTYGYHLDRRMWKDATELFAADGTMELGLQGVYAGKAGIRRGFDALQSAGLVGAEVNDHVHLQTIVTVSPDGRTARARGTELGMVSSTGNAWWSQSIYENEFVKQGNTWRFKAMHLYPRFIVDAAQGWGKSAIPAPAPSREFPPDRPPTESYEIFPRFHIAPLHFDHPVTGRPPQYPSDTRVAARARPAARATQPPTSARALEKLLVSTERAVERSGAYHVSENLATAHGYALDESARAANTLTLHHVVQPVIAVSTDGRSSRIRARLFQLGNSAGGEGSWTSGIYEGTAVVDNGRWKLSRMDLTRTWTAPSRGGWVRPVRP
jgi:hypothetical protein